MKKAHQLLPNAAFFGAIGFVYFGFADWATILASVLIAAFVYFDEIEESSVFKYSIKHFGSFLLFVPLGYFQLSVLPIGILTFLVGLITAYIRLTSFQGNVPRIIIAVVLASVIGFYLPSKMAEFQTHTQMNEEAPKFVVQDFETGRSISKESLKGKIVIVNFCIRIKIFLLYFIFYNRSIYL